MIIDSIKRFLGLETAVISNEKIYLPSADYSAKQAKKFASTFPIEKFSELQLATIERIKSAVERGETETEYWYHVDGNPPRKDEIEMFTWLTSKGYKITVKPRRIFIYPEFEMRPMTFIQW